MYYILCIIFAIFFNGTLSNWLGFNETFTLSTLPLVILIGSSVISGKLNVSHNLKNYVFSVVLLSIFISFFGYSHDSNVGFIQSKIAIQLLIVPAFIIIYMENASITQILNLKKIVIYFFLIEATISIVEKITLSLAFNFESSTYLSNNYEFRSRSLMGDPLNNAMLITTILAFIATTKKLSSANKLLLFFLGFFSLLSFNARWAILISVFIIFPRIIFELISQFKNKFNRNIFLILLTIAINFLVIYLFNSDFGGRLLHNEELYDGSAETRLKVFEFYKFINSWDLLFGNSLNEKFLLSKLNSAGIENGIIAMIVHFGIIFTVPILVFTFKMYNTLLKVYSFIDRVFILIVFYMVGVSNPNLVIPVQHIIFLFSYYSFRNFKIFNTSNRLKLANSILRI